MGTFNLTITYPDDKQAELLAALREHFGQIEEVDGEGVATSRDRTPAELVDGLERLTQSQIKRIYIKYIRRQNPVSIDLT